MRVINGLRGRGSPWCLGEQVQLVRVSRGWEDRESPGVLGEQVQLMGEQALEDLVCPWCLGEQLQVMRVSRRLGGQGVPQEL